MPIAPPFRHLHDSRLRVLPEDPAAMVAPRRKSPSGKTSRRPHPDANVATVRRLIEQTVLTYGEIAARTGVGRASICRWTRDGGWKRPLFAPRATDTVPRERASAQLKRRTLAARLTALAERAIRELEASASVDLYALAEALELVKMAKLAARPRQRREPANKLEARLIAEAKIFDAGPRDVLRGLRAAGVRVERAPEEALEDFIASRAPPPKRLTRRQRQHKWMLERE